MASTKLPPGFIPVPLTPGGVISVPSTQQVPNYWTYMINAVYQNVSASIPVQKMFGLSGSMGMDPDVYMGRSVPHPHWVTLKGAIEAATANYVSPYTEKLLTLLLASSMVGSMGKASGKDLIRLVRSMQSNLNIDMDGNEIIPGPNSGYFSTPSGFGYVPQMTAYGVATSFSGGGSSGYVVQGPEDNEVGFGMWEKWIENFAEGLGCEPLVGMRNLIDPANNGRQKISATAHLIGEKQEVPTSTNPHTGGVASAGDVCESLSGPIQSLLKKQIGGVKPGAYCELKRIVTDFSSGLKIAEQLVG